VQHNWLMRGHQHRAEPFVETAEALIRLGRYEDACAYLELAKFRALPAEPGAIVDTAAYGVRPLLARAVIAMHRTGFGETRRLIDEVLDDPDAPPAERIRAHLLEMVVAERRAREVR